MTKRIYLDNAATTFVSKEVLDCILPFFTENFGNPSSIYSEGRVARAAVEKSRRNISKILSAIPAEIFFTSGGTEANNTALKCAVRDLGVNRIISSPIEHACVRNSVLCLFKFENVEFEYVKLDQYGRADLEDLKLLLSSSSKKTLVSLMHSNNEIGTLNDIVSIGKLCADYNAYFHTDTVQTIGYYKINTAEFPVHFLSGSAHKLHGPKGSGFLYVNKNVQIGPFIDGGGQERTLRSGTENVTGIVGLGKAVEEAHSNMDAFRTKIESIRNYFLESLQSDFKDLVSFNGDIYGQNHYKVLSVNFDTPIPSDMLMFRLDLAGISVSGGSACSSGSLKGSPVLHALGLPSHLRTIRFSFSHFNTEEEIDFTIEKLREIVLNR
jgi:cysteine desulfurase